jgi:hypothetical protein
MIRTQNGRGRPRGDAWRPPESPDVNESAAGKPAPFVSTSGAPRRQCGAEGAQHDKGS